MRIFEQYLIYFIVHLEQLDATIGEIYYKFKSISRVRTDYDIIDPQKLEDDESNDDIEYYYEKSASSNVSEPNYEGEQQHFVEEMNEPECEEINNLIKTGASIDDEESSKEESEENDYENYNPSFLQIPNNEDQSVEVEKEEVDHELIIENKEKINEDDRDSSENSSYIPDENLESEDSKIVYQSSDSSYLNEIHDCLKQIDQKQEINYQLQAKYHHQTPAILVPVGGNGESGLGFSKFDPVKFESDQNVI